MKFLSTQFHFSKHTKLQFNFHCKNLNDFIWELWPISLIYKQAIFSAVI